MAASLGSLTAVLNLIVCFFMMYVERKLLCDGKLPQRGILRIKDYNFFMLGDLVFVTIMDFAILYVLVHGWPLSVMAIIACLSAAFAWTAMWHSIWLSPSHRWDSFYPRTGVVSLLGKIHLVYFAVQYALGFMGLWMVGYMVVGYRPWLLWVAVVGLASAAVYFITLASDLARGKFKRPVVPHG